jgi:hypothetical protein
MHIQMLPTFIHVIDMPPLISVTYIVFAITFTVVTFNPIELVVLVDFLNRHHHFYSKTKHL